MRDAENDGRFCKGLHQGRGGLWLGLFWSWRLRDASAWIMISMFSGVSCSDIVPLSKVSFIQPCAVMSEVGFVRVCSFAFGWSSVY